MAKKYGKVCDPEKEAIIDSKTFGFLREMSIYMEVVLDTGHISPNPKCGGKSS